LRLTPTALFAATPIAAAPVALKERVAGGLAGDGVPMTGSRHVPKRRAGRARNLVRAGIAVTVAALVLGTAAVVLAGGGGGPEPGEVAGPDAGVARVTTTTSTTTSTTTTTAPPQPIAPGDEPALAPTSDAPPGPAGDTAADAVIVEEPPPPPPVTVTANLAMAPATMPLAYSMSAPPVLSWSTAGGASVLVTGPGLSSAVPSGSAPVCPGSTSAVCTAPPGTYAYTLVVRGGWGQVVAQRTATLTIT
jgi:hypothetical protein